MAKFLVIHPVYCETMQAHGPNMQTVGSVIEPAAPTAGVGLYPLDAEAFQISRTAFLARPLSQRNVIRKDIARFRTGLTPKFNRMINDAEHQLGVYTAEPKAKR